MEKWTTEMIGSQIGKTALVTCGTEGAGLDVATGTGPKWSEGNPLCRGCY
jgi:hypothetical protein